ncbi:ABC transporter substrate-binding protein [Streptomyces sp. DSM 44915]|uniref:Thiamine pyrimidine synthase n=1 Tax=Streptomyces chisholmiae TaxID=3075540 RepID=A0ABU2JUZ5_9ACTN|nr:ABC transporter substrate-binding protein [Streptomyces sp. DSM 44915]MDT0268775.1 ABC transporter substrate-binding protein [Streptomyces sp. DSM 44915]
MTANRPPFPGRRRFLTGGLALGGLALAAGPLAGCAPGEPDAAPDAEAGGSAGFGLASQRLAWVKNTQFAGSFLADHHGYYTEEGFSGADLVAGGPTAPPIESDVLDRTFAGVSQIAGVGAAINEGAPLKIIGAVYQRNASCVMSLSERPVREPTDLYGKTVGCSSSSAPLWRLFLTALGLDQSRITTVPVQGDPIGMTEGEIDAYFGYTNNQPIELRARGFEIDELLLADAGFPLVGQTYITTQENLDQHRDKVKGFLRAEIRGWLDVLADPELATRVTVEDYGRTLGLDPETTLTACRVGNELILDGDPGQHILALSEETVAANIEAANAGGLAITAEELFDLDPIREVFAEDPGLALDA